MFLLEWLNHHLANSSKLCICYIVGIFFIIVFWHFIVLVVRSFWIVILLFFVEIKVGIVLKN